ncbi:MAG: ParB/RepB/Spo0J family partition protein, partial [Pseudomonadota bacterium]
MSKRHDSLIDGVLSDLGPAPAPAEAPARPDPRENRFLRRSSALADRAAGALVEKTLRWVDPARCRMWDRHNRRYDLLDAQNCADLIEGIRAQGGQEFPAIVRALHDDPDHDYEVICGARRHWSVSWLRANNYPQFRFLIEVRELTDEEAFRLADIENRDRRDISDYERALDYAEACRFYYDGHQGRMAARLEVSNAWLSRYLDLAALPPEIPAAYGDLHDLREFHARRLKPCLAGMIMRERVLKEAGRLARDQAALRKAGKPRLAGAKVLAQLIAAANPEEREGEGAKPAPKIYRNAAGDPVLTATMKPKGLHLTLTPGTSRTDLEQAFAALMDDHTKDGSLPGKILPIGKTG